MSLSTVVRTATALVAFAANSVFCRLALRDQAIDPATFTTIRLASGAAALLLLQRTRGSRKGRGPGGGSWRSAGVLFLYAAPFSFAYTSVTAGTGALILFGCVQVTMMAAALGLGERPSPLQWSGLALASAGLVYLVLPGLSAPPAAGAALMGLAGCGWGLYSLLGRGSVAPLAHTAGNFARALPLALIVSAAGVTPFQLSPAGALLALASGALASGLGYVVWYAALGGLTATRAAAVQLAVPVLAAGGGVVFLEERISFRLIGAAVLVLGGIGLAMRARERERRATGSEHVAAENAPGDESIER